MKNTPQNIVDALFSLQGDDFVTAIKSISVRLKGLTALNLEAASVQTLHLVWNGHTARSSLDSQGCGNLIAMIKAIRTAFGYGLRESKDIADGKNYHFPLMTPDAAAEFLSEVVSAGGIIRVERGGNLRYRVGGQTCTLTEHLAIIHPGTPVTFYYDP